MCIQCCIRFWIMIYTTVYIVKAEVETWNVQNYLDQASEAEHWYTSSWALMYISDVDIERAMMTSSNGNIFRVTDPLCGEFTGHRWIPLTKASDAELGCFLWSALEQTVKQAIWDAVALIMTSLWWLSCHAAFMWRSKCWLLVSDLTIVVYCK